MKLYQSMFVLVISLFSSFTHSSSPSGDTIHSSAYLKGSIKAFYVEFTVKLKDSDNGKGGQDVYGEMNVYLNQSDETHKVWERSKNDTYETLTINVVTGALIGSESKENYITLSGNIWDDDLAGNPNDHLCNLNSSVKIYQKDVGKRLTNVFTGGDRQCEYLEVTKFTLAE